MDDNVELEKDSTEPKPEIQINRDDKDEVLEILKERKKEIKFQLDELKKFLPNYGEDKHQRLSKKTMLLIAAGTVTAGGLLFLALNQSARSTT